MKIGVTDQLKVSSLQPAKINIILQPNYCSILTNRKRNVTV